MARSRGTKNMFLPRWACYFAVPPTCVGNQPLHSLFINQDRYLYVQILPRLSYEIGFVLLGSLPAVTVMRACFFYSHHKCLTAVRTYHIVALVRTSAPRAKVPTSQSCCCVLCLVTSHIEQCLDMHDKGSAPRAADAARYQTPATLAQGRIPGTTKCEEGRKKSPMIWCNYRFDNAKSYLCRA